MSTKRSREDKGSQQGGGQGGRRYVRARRLCRFCAEKIDYIDYKDTKLIGNFIPERGKILPRRISGTCAPHQRMLATAIRRARNVALLPIVSD
jgi:small subunit ribosomal protein S18